MEAIKIVEYNMKRVLKAACKVAATLFSGLSVLLCFESKDSEGKEKLTISALGLIM